MEENSNKNATMAATQRDLIAGEVSKDLTKRIMLPERFPRRMKKACCIFMMPTILFSLFSTAA